MASNNNIEALIGTWEHVRSENFEGFLKEMGVPMAIRLLAKSMSTRLVINENNGIWTLRTEMPLKTKSISFTPGIQFQDTTPDGSEVQTVVRFEDGKWVQTLSGKNGKESMVTRFIDDQGLQQIEMTSGTVKARRWFKRV
ncbi:unnamed protein product, partial [Rotaria sp. Silwood1]